MDKAIEIYSSVIYEKFTAFRIISFLFILTACSEVESIDYKSTTEWFLRKSIAQLIDLSSLKEKFILWIVFCALVFVFLSSWAFEKASKFILKKQLPMVEFMASLEHVKNNFCLSSDARTSEKLELGKYIEDNSKSLRTQIKFSYGLAEMFFTISIFLLFFLYWGGIFDVLASAIFIMISMGFLIKSHLLFVSQMSKFLVAKSFLFGVDIKKVFNLDDTL